VRGTIDFMGITSGRVLVLVFGRNAKIPTNKPSRKNADILKMQGRTRGGKDTGSE